MNPFLQRLGYGPADRVAIIHADDFGMCHATIPAVVALFEAGLVSSAAVMPPCPWAAEAAGACREGRASDVGVHTTLTSEWARYRWGPLSTRERASGLLDAEGAFPRGCQELWAQIDPQAAAAELRAQIEWALAGGIDVTHIDSHMGAVFQPGLLDAYLELAGEYRVPAMLPRMTAEGLRARGITDEGRVAEIVAGQAAYEARGLPLVDHIVGMPLDRHADRIDEAKRIFDGLPAGLSYVILHPAADTPELQAIAPDWRGRVADFEAFRSAELRDYVRASNIQVIGWRPIRDALAG